MKQPLCMINFLYNVKTNSGFLIYELWINFFLFCKIQNNLFEHIKLFFKYKRNRYFKFISYLLFDNCIKSLINSNSRRIRKKYSYSLSFFFFSFLTIFSFLHKGEKKTFSTLKRYPLLVLIAIIYKIPNL